MSLPNLSSANPRAAFYARLDQQSMAPLWESLHALVPPRPATEVKPSVWRYAQMRPYLMEAGELITAAEAERRVLILENEGLRGQAAVTQSLYAGLQLILPGEVAPAHRHAQSALRLVLEGEGAYTAVDGERIPMSRGDFIITPAHTWHDHGHDGQGPVVWLDGLDIPLVRFMGAGFAEKASDSMQQVTKPQGDSLARYGCNMVPVDYQAAPETPSRLCHFRYVDTRAALTQLLRSTPDVHTGHKLRFVNPATGRSPMQTIGTYVQALPAGFSTAPLRSTDSTVYCCLEGRGLARIGELEVAFDERDIFVVPSWVTVQLEAAVECVLFSYSDRPVQEALGLWKEERS
ncbi:gentisate 1,2-dioxygenase [Pseudomonas sp. P115]|nr:gentisate 1,2-dioxygenase [Pseudomonas pisciculturae]MBF6029794.1 gentisate 1,2-dioxygenase [Pseudomonas pisciculturae]